MTLISKFQITSLISNLTKTVSKIRVSLMSAINCSVKRKLKKDESDVNLTDDTTELKKKQKVILPEYSLDDSGYYIDNGLRKVYPYYFTYYSHCKGRWMGQPLGQFYCSEFRAMPLEKIKGRIEEGLLLINNQKVDINYKLKGHDVLTHRLHRHEMPVLSAPIPVIHSSKDLLVVDKPPSIPIHPCGKYRHNSLMSVIRKEHKLDSLHTIHRLDRLTSGIVLIARNTGIAQKFHEEIRNRLVSKEYVCRVEGKFPDGVITCDQPIECLSHRIGICMIDPKGKTCSTSFERLNYNGKSSTVLCKPVTGRMHQIRVHLQYLGHPILNDTFYNNDVFGTQKGKNGDFGKSREQLIKDIEEQHQRSIYLMSNKNAIKLSPEEQELSNKKREIALKALFHYTNREEWNSMKEMYKLDSNKLVDDKDCEECLNKTIDPNPSELLIYLHALSYKGSDWQYKTTLPIWAKDDWDYD